MNGVLRIVPYQAKQRNRVFAKKDHEFTISGQFDSKKGPDANNQGIEVQ